MKVDVYRNVSDDCLSVRSREQEDYGVVVSHQQKTHLRDVEFVVQESGRKKFCESGRRRAHAFVRGIWDETVRVIAGEKVTYNPFEYEHFVHEQSGRAVAEAERTAVTTNSVYATGLQFVGKTTK